MNRPGRSPAAAQVLRLARFAVTTQDTDRLVRFWTSAFDCRELSRTPAARERPGTTLVALGTSLVEILEFDQPGRPYPSDLSPADNEFQHLAIVVSDMARAFARLRTLPGWTAITHSQPQRLPSSSGGVTAFKFRDCDGHPLEFLNFPAATTPPVWTARSDDDLHMGIDHSAISVADVARSVAFYEHLGLQVAARSLNQGPEQALLDGVADPQVDVIALVPMDATPHVELLCYRNAARRRRFAIQENDVFASRLIFDSAPGPGGNTEPRLIEDPDGHRLEIRP